MYLWVYRIGAHYSVGGHEKGSPQEVETDILLASVGFIHSFIHSDQGLIESQLPEPYRQMARL